jgi:tRNA dimethylallyltransferase
VAECDRRGRAPLLVGGTGLYLRALAKPLFAEPALDQARRSALAALLDAMPVDELRRWVRTLDPVRAGLQRTQLLRAVEVALLTGERISALHARHARPPRFAVRYLVVDPGPVLATRIEHRVDAMLAAGWLSEVAALAARLPPDAPAWQSTGYDSWRAHLDGALGFAEARARVVVATRQYAKRQRTWFRHQLAGASVVRVNPDAPDTPELARAWWRGEVPTAAPTALPDEDAA